MYIKKLAVLVLISSLLATNVAQAYSWNTTAKVVLTESTYMPGAVAFQIDRATSGCPLGSFVTWPAHGTDPADKRDNAKATLALLMAAQMSGRTINLFGTGCVAEYVHLN
jgi:hypothetical protein